MAMIEQLLNLPIDMQPVMGTHIGRVQQRLDLTTSIQPAFDTHVKAALPSDLLGHGEQLRAASGRVQTRALIVARRGDRATRHNYANFNGHLCIQSATVGGPIAERRPPNDEKTTSTR